METPTGRKRKKARRRRRADGGQHGHETQLVVVTFWRPEQEVSAVQGLIWIPVRPEDQIQEPKKLFSTVRIFKCLRS